MANGYIVGTVLDLVSGYTSTTAKVQIYLGTVLKRTLYLTKASADQDWNYSTAMAPTVSPNTYTVNATNTTPTPNYAYQSQTGVVVASAQPTVVHFLSKGSIGALAGAAADDANADLEVDREKVERKHKDLLKILRLGMTIVEVDEPPPPASPAASV